MRSSKSIHFKNLAGIILSVSISSPFNKIHAELHIEGDIPADKIIRAAHLSFDKYCSVSKNLEKTSEIVHSIVLNGEKIKIA